MAKWTTKERQYLIDNYTTKGVLECAKSLGRTKRNVTAYAYVLRQQNHMPPLAEKLPYKPWTVPEENWLIKHYRPGLGVWAARKLQRTHGSIKTKLGKLRKLGRLSLTESDVA